MDIDEINEETFSKNLYFDEEPELIIRTGGEKRLFKYIYGYDNPIKRKKESIERYERHATMLNSIVVFVGKASLDVYRRNIISKNTKMVKLTLRKEGTKFIFIWKLRKPDE